MPVHVHQGGQDRNVPPAMGRGLAESRPRGIFHYYPEEGHLSILVNACPDFIRDFLNA